MAGLFDPLNSIAGFVRKNLFGEEQVASPPGAGGGGGGGAGGAGDAPRVPTPVPTPARNPVVGNFSGGPVNVGGQLVSGQKATSPSPTSTGGAGGSGGAPVPTPAPTPAPTPEPGFDYQSEVEKQKATEADRTRALQENQRAEIGKAYDPIFSELDRQIGILPGQESELTTSINRLAELQKGQVGTQLATGQSQIAGARTEADIRAGENKRQAGEVAKGSIRDIEGDVRNLLSSAGNYLGARGAGSSSAVGQASEAVTREALKAKGKVATTQAESNRQFDLAKEETFRSLDQKQTEIQNLAGEQDLKIEEWKVNKLTELGQSFVDQRNKLELAKANSSAEKQKAISDMIFGLEQKLLSDLSALDNNVIGYKQSVNTWQQQRSAELEDFKTKLNMETSAAVGRAGSTGPKPSDVLAAQKYQSDLAINIFNTVLDQMVGGSKAPATSEQINTARQAAFNQTGFDPYGKTEKDEQTGELVLSPLTDELPVEETTPWDNLVGGVKNLFGF